MPKYSHLKFLADENFRADVARTLRKWGCDIRYGQKSLKNGELFKMSIEKNRILLTHDQDFADTKRYPASRTPGILVLKIHPPVPKKILTALENLLNKTSPDKLNGRLFLVTEKDFVIKK